MSNKNQRENFLVHFYTRFKKGSCSHVRGQFTPAPTTVWIFGKFNCQFEGVRFLRVIMRVVLVSSYFSLFFFFSGIKIILWSGFRIRDF